jgi:pyruvate dehydrogenase E1 component beta subunit/2-oxoisovalerate dehydrogenase E1 component
VTTKTGPKFNLTHDELLEFYRQMLRIRRFEEKCAELYQAEKIRGFLHLAIGEEAIAAAIMRVLRPDDAIVSTYREHGHALARGIPMRAIMAEMFGKAAGCSGGRGGSMHLFDKATRFYGGNAIVGGGLPLAVGAALADKMQGHDSIAVCFFGEGAVAEGEFHESLNLAALWKLPVLFVCENNLYAMGTRLDLSESQPDIHLKAQSYNMPSEVVDGMDVVALAAAAHRAVAAIRNGDGPYFLECRTYRFRAHSMFDPQLYRDKAEVEAWKAKDPLLRFRTWLHEAHLLHDEALQAVEQAVDAEIEDAISFADAAQWEPVETLTEHVYGAAAPAVLPAVTAPAGKLTYRDAAREGLRAAFMRDPQVFMMGEDIGRYGGCYAVSKGMLAEFGPGRIRDTPLSESGFVGAGIGAAMSGMRPIVEVMTVNFSLLALDQIVNSAATIRHMSGGQFGVPLVLRMATGAGRQLAAQHSHSLEGWFAHIPGIKVLAPATHEDVFGMLLTALEDPDPVLIFEHVMLYNTEGALPENAGAVDISKAAIRRPGSDVTLITYGGSLPKTLAAADQLAALGISAEVIDLRILRPLDSATIIASVAKTRHALIVDEGWRTGSLSAEIFAIIVEQAFWELDAPIARVCSTEVPIPYPRHLEEAALPQTPAIVAAVQKLMSK